MSSFNSASQEFLVWLSKSGAEVSENLKLQDLREIQAGRGVVAVKDIAEDELLFRIPRSSILSVENSILSKEIPKATFEHLGPWLSLILVMLYEYQNGDASNWAPYFRVLPSEFNTLMFWSREELEELQASAVRSKIGKESTDETFKNELLPVIEECADIFFCGAADAKQRAAAMGQPHNLQLMHKMGTLIMAYAFDVEPAESIKNVDEEGYASEEEDEDLPKGMVPLADMLNADADRNNARLFYEENFLSMKALKPIKAGEEIFNDYGPLPRSDLLRRYGYITDNYAPYDVAELPLDTISRVFQDHNGILDEQKLEYLDEHGVLDSGYDITASEPFALYKSLSPQLIVLAEVLILSDEEFNRLKARGKLPKPDKVTLEGAKLLHEMVKARIAEYATSVEEDTREPVTIPLNDKYVSKERRIAMAKLVRIGEKNILKSVERALAARVQELGATNGTSKRSRQDTEDGASGKKQKR